MLPLGDVAGWRYAGVPLDESEKQRLIEAGRRAAQAWLDERVIAKLESRVELDLWLTALVNGDGSARIIPGRDRPEGEAVIEDGPTSGPDGEPRAGLRLWRVLEYVALSYGACAAILVEREVFDDQGNKRDLWMPG